MNPLAALLAADHDQVILTERDGELFRHVSGPGRCCRNGKRLA